MLCFNRVALILLNNYFSLLRNYAAMITLSPLDIFQIIVFNVIIEYFSLQLLRRRGLKLALICPLRSEKNKPIIFLFIRENYLDLYNGKLRTHNSN